MTESSYWEYEWFKNSSLPKEYLNKLGQDGWEVVAIHYSVRDKDWRALCKRQCEKQPDKAPDIEI